MPVNQPSQLGIFIRRYRLEAGLSQDRLAERSGLSARAVSGLERAVRAHTRLETLRMLANGLELNADGLSALIASTRPQALTPANIDAPGLATYAARPLPSLPMLTGRLFGRNVDAAFAQAWWEGRESTFEGRLPEIEAVLSAARKVMAKT